MRTLLVTILISATAAGCNTTECGAGTIARDGTCVPGDEVVGAAACGPMTELHGDICVPTFEPTICDPASTEPDVDENGVTTCIGTGGGGCNLPLACPAPSAGKQTICGRLYDFETSAPFEAEGALGTACTFGMPSASGPCALGLVAYDAVEFAMNPAGATPRPVGQTYVDDCGRYRLTDVDPGASPYIGLGIDDAIPANRGPGGITNVVGVATAKAVDLTTKDLAAFIVRSSTTAQWQASGGPGIAGGYFAPVFRANRTGLATQAGVTVLKIAGPVPNNDFYFPAVQTTRTTIDTDATATGANGTALVSGASLADTAYLGTGGLPPECKYSPAPGVALPGVVFISVYRPIDATGMTCAR